jgi:choline dehydrogenase-like flavoprotein
MSLLTSSQEDLIRSVIQAFRPPDCPITTEQATRRAMWFIDQLAESGSDRVDEIRTLLTALDVSLVFVNRNDRSAVRERLTEMERGTFLLGLARQEVRGLARFAQRLAAMVLYATPAEDGPERGRPAAALRLGYQVFEDRLGQTPAIPEEPVLPPRIFCAPGQRVPRHRYDVVIVGSGSAGAVAARRLVEAGLDVAVVESGQYTVESAKTPAGPHARARPQPHDELESLLRYYKHAGMQISTPEHPIFIFQGECLGGSSVINNAVCFRMPDGIRDKWNEKYGIPWTRDGRLDSAYDAIARDLGIDSAETVAEALNASGKFLRSGAAALHLPPDAIKACHVNLRHDPKCLGCGYCNLTCAYLRKQSVLQTMFPAAVRSMEQGRGRLTIYTGRKAVALAMDVRMRALGVHFHEKRDPGIRGTIKAKRVIVSAGAIASSVLLQRTATLNALRLPVGRRFSFNFGSPIHAEYAEPVDAFRGLQIAHYYDGDLPAGGFVVETWYNPPAAQSLALPGWMDELDANLRRYRYYACAAPLIGSSARSVIDARWLTPGEDIRIRLQDRDLDRLKQGLLKTCELFFHSDPPPVRVLLGTLDDWEVSRSTYRHIISRIAGWHEVQIGTGHPQGGNCLSHLSGTDGGPGVVRPDFRVYGTRNLYVVDASVFPTSLGVNPHWTVMAIADLAAREVLAGA